MIGYGQLDMILVCTVPSKPQFRRYAGKVTLLGVVTPCQTKGADARLSLVDYNKTLKPLVMDIRDITAVVGRARTRDRWWVIDQFDSCAIPTFGDPEEAHNDSDGLDSDNE